MNNQIRTRFAPSPTGYLHVGGLRSALYGYLYAKKTGGKFILRIEDTDQGRLVEGATEKILAAMKETGLIYDEGPDVGGNYGPYIQSQRKNEYMKYALELVEKGAAYYCFCDKARLENLPDVNGARRYDKHCLSLTKEQIKAKLDNGEPFVIRQNMPTVGSTTYHDCVYGDITVANSELEDQILIKSDGMPTYNFANVVDDHLMAINCVMRGNEYLSSTPKYNLLYDAFGWEKPMYIHMPVIMRDAQHKLSKRNGDAAYSDFIEKGYLREAVLNYIALLGWSPKNNQEKMSLIEMENLFSIEGINKSPAIFDPMKMNWLNGLYIKEMDFDAFMDYATPFIQKTKVAGKYDMVKLCKLLQGRIEFFGEIGDKVDFLEEFGEYDTELYINQKQKSDKEIAATVLPHVLETLNSVETWENSALYEALKNLAVSLDLKNSQILWPTRIALSGRDSTPGGATELAELIGKDETIKRLKFSIDLLNK
ncbi:MAG TPA: glutamate--tRNA ligase [Eubacteriales bacterium]|nr:glutamate--tRNA ligase [Eubacteriales bacterium]